MQILALLPVGMFPNLSGLQLLIYEEGAGTLCLGVCGEPGTKGVGGAALCVYDRLFPASV